VGFLFLGSFGFGLIPSYSRLLRYRFICLTSAKNFRK